MPVNMVKTKRHWRDDELTALREMHGSVTVDAIAEVLSLPVSRVRAKIRDLRLEKAPPPKYRRMGTATNTGVLNRLLRERGLMGCEVCGESRWLDFHHRDGDPSNNDDTNIGILCPNHHQELERPVLQWRVCKTCGRPYLISTGHVKRGAYIKYCSMECRSALVERRCEICGAMFKVSPNSKSATTRRFCGRTCQATAVSAIRWRKEHAG